MEIATGLVIGFVAGCVAGFFLAQRLGSGARLSTQVEERDKRIAELQEAVERKEELLRQTMAERSAIAAARTATEEKVAELKALRSQLEAEFKALAGDVLRANSESFLALAGKQLDALLTRSDTSIGKNVQPLSDALKRYEEGLKTIERDYSGLTTQVRNLDQRSMDLRKETGNLVNVLRNPQMQGRWGELTLRRTAEMAGMAEHCDFIEQAHVAGDAGAMIPDMIVNLPSGRRIVVDSKAPLVSYEQAVTAANDEERQAKFKEHARRIREHMRTLSGKAYHEQFKEAAEFTVMFLPGEGLFAAGARHDPSLIEDGMKQNIFIATPVTFIALLRIVAQGWREAQLTENAQKISAQGRELFSRVKKFVAHVEKAGSYLQKLVRSYNAAIGSYETRIRPAAEQLKQLGATAGEGLSEIRPVGTAPRLPAAAPSDDGPRDEDA